MALYSKVLKIKTASQQKEFFQISLLVGSENKSNCDFAEKIKTSQYNSGEIQERLQMHKVPRYLQ
jgi:hypothetical protein